MIIQLVDVKIMIILHISNWCSVDYTINGNSASFLSYSIQLAIFLLHCQIKTYGSESQGQEEAGLRDEPASYLQVAPL